MEVTNKMRSEWAEKALSVFTNDTFSGRTAEQLHTDDREDAVIDLICDLLHYAKEQGFSCDHIVRRSVALFNEEAQEE